ncbi:MFS transporter [Casimicrobium huifangae]|uniref:MFS transporter n=1 Tax=Casimicrobium huifangae TaxID=2591109 RepID=UPI001EE30B68|nr:MFS transporter [Casimicrobium huifangae]
MTVNATATNSAALPVTRREVWSWAMYDFANSGYTTVVITAIFNAFFVSVIAGGADWATLLWTTVVAISYVIVMIVGPVLGAWADRRAAKKRVLALATVGCVLTTLALAPVAAQGDAWLIAACVLFIASNVFYSLGENFTAAFLPELATSEHIARVSAWGWSLGYVGGLVTLGVCLWWVLSQQAAGAKAIDYIPWTLVITAVVYALASIPTFLFLRERAVPRASVAEDDAGHVMRGIATKLARSMRELRQYPDLRRFFWAGLAYQAGLAVVITLASVYAEQALGFKMADTIKLLLVVNVSAAIGAFLFGYVQDRIGHKPTLAITLLMWIATVVIAYVWHTQTGFWVAANLAGLCLGASQSGGRALVGILSPRQRVAEFYGLWGLVVRLAGVIGPLLYGTVTWATAGNHRLALLITGGMFVIGLVLLARVDVGAGERAAGRASA